VTFGCVFYNESFSTQRIGEAPGKLWIVFHEKNANDRLREYFSAEVAATSAGVKRGNLKELKRLSDSFQSERALIPA
jgi:hypothetical protein